MFRGKFYFKPLSNLNHSFSPCPEPYPLRTEINQLEGSFVFYKLHLCLKVFLFLNNHHILRSYSKKKAFLPLVKLKGQFKLGAVYAKAQRALIDNSCVQYVHWMATYKGGDKEISRSFINLLRCTNLLNLSLVNYCHPVRKGHRLCLVMGNIDHRDAKLSVEFFQFCPHINP